MNESLIERLTSTPEGMRLYQQERTIQEATDLICQMMNEDNVSRAELAKRLGKTKSYVTQLLDGRTNMTLRTISDVLLVLDRVIHFQDGPVSTTVCTEPFMAIAPDWSTAAPWPVESMRPSFACVVNEQKMVS